MQSRRRMRSSLLSVLTGSTLGSSVCCFFFLFFSFVAVKVSVTCQPSVCVLPSQKCHLCVPVFPQWLLRSSFLLSLSSLHRSSSSSFSRSSRHCHICLALYHLLRLNWAGSISTETCGDFLRKEEGEFLFLRTYPPLLGCRCFSFPVSFFFSLFLKHFFQHFLMNWSSLREEGLLVSLEGEGGELVPYSSLQECAIWFENGETCHTLFCLFHPSICPCKLCLPPFTCCSIFAWPELAPGLSALWSGSWSGCVGHWFEWRLYRHGANGRSAGK